MMDVEIRPARPEDAGFLAWVILTAGRAHVTRGIWEVILGGTEQDNQDFLKALAVATTPHLFHYSCYLIAEADGRPAAGLGGYDPKICGYEALYRAIPEVLKKMGHSGGPDPETHKRAERVLCCIPEDAEGAWIIDSVATLPEYRRKGLVDRLLVAILEKGRQEGFQKAQISIYIDNRPAQRAYEKHGFKIQKLNLQQRLVQFRAQVHSSGQMITITAEGPSQSQSKVQLNQLLAP